MNGGDLFYGLLFADSAEIYRMYKMIFDFHCRKFFQFTTQKRRKKWKHVKTKLE